MIQHIQNLPLTIVGFKASGEITEKDFIDIVMLKVKVLIDKTDKLNYLLVLDTPVKNFTIGAWIKDAITGIKHLTKCNRATIVSNVEAIRNYTNFFRYLISGEFKGFEHNYLQKAIYWVSEKN